MKAGWFRSILRRRLIMVLLVLLQMAFMVYAIISTGIAYKAFAISFKLISLLVCIHIASKNDNGAFRLSWVFLILTFPLFGGLVYLFFKLQSPNKKMTQRINAIDERWKDLTFISDRAMKEASALYPSREKLMRYLESHASFPVYKNSKTEYLPSGEEKQARLLKELEKAEKYIFLEYFIIQDGVMWNEILEILKRKAANGVDVRVMYDDMGCFVMLPWNYKKKLEEMGISCTVFNPFMPMLTSVQNNRDHRKIAVIDGKVAFTGGINLADHYINLSQKHGHWKDSAIVTEGEAAWSFTLMFLKMWELSTGRTEDNSVFYPYANHPCPILTDGYVQPYADSPMDGETTGQNVYLSVINNAKKYLYITTPYLIIDECMLSALRLAAKSGVDVRIITPHVWDKWAIHMTTRSFYKELIDSGVRVYEYTPGFIHSKTFVSDDEIACVGTTNLDFRSLYLHFECGAVLYGSSAVGQVKNDFMQTLEKCCEITKKNYKCGFFMKCFQNVMRLFGPLL